MQTVRDKLVELAIIRWQLREQALAATGRKEPSRAKPDEKPVRSDT